VFLKMEKLTNHPIYRNDFTILLSSLNRWDYKYETWSNRHYIKKSDTILFFLHELLHFQTIYYYKEYIISKLHDEHKFEDLKESLTFLLNHEFNDIIEWPDQWYPQHKELRRQLEEYRLSQSENERDFEKLIDYWCDVILQQI
jgi:membrane protein CcdC involved in cytochrome C biogenesis